MITNARALGFWARTQIVVWPGDYLLVHLPLEQAREAALLATSAGGLTSFLRERDEVSLGLPAGDWPKEGPLLAVARVGGPWRAITLDVDVDPDVCGYLAPAAERLAAAGVPIVPLGAYLKDHLLVPAARLDDALDVLEGLIRGARVAVAR